MDKIKIAVSFPKLGLDLNVPREAFNIFNVPIYWYGIIIALAFFVCVVWAMKDSRKFGLIPDDVIDLMLFAGPVAIVCARLYYVIFKWEDYKYDLKQIVNIRNGGLAVLGGIIGAVIVAYFLARHKKIPVLKFFDFAIPYVALGQAIGRWGNFFNQEAFGTNTSLPWGMTSPAIKSYLSDNAQSLKAQYGITVYPDMPVHPTFLYESIVCIGIFAFLLWMRKKKKFEGEVFCLYFIIYGIGRAIIEGMRTDSLMIGNLRASQLLSVVLAAVFFIYVIFKRSRIANNLDMAEVGHSGYANVLKLMEEDERKETAGNTENVQTVSGNTPEKSESPEETEAVEKTETDEAAEPVEETEAHEPAGEEAGADDLSENKPEE